MYDVDATPTEPTTTMDETVTKLARAFADGGLAKLGRFVVGRVVDGWTTRLTFADIHSGNTYTAEISTDGPHHAAEQAYEWWTRDAWEIPHPTKWDG